MVTRLTGKKKKLSEFIIEEIKQQLIEGQLSEGDKLPNQNEFAQMLGVSRLSLREALNTLDQMGVIEQKTGVGTVIISGNPDLWGEKPEAPLLADSKATLELLEARRSLETMISTISVKRIENIEIAALEAEISNMQKAIDERNYEDYLKSDISFHYQLVKGAHNRYLLHMFLDIRNLMEKFMKESFYKQPSMMEISFGHHMNILGSIKARDPDAAKKSITDHIEEIESLVENYYREHGQL
jgi:GntR family transcriptional regulator, transcriptional repressor for pyruvate dehydrogenase complex